MKPIYFPYTYVTPPTARAISNYFNSMIVYQASARPLPAEMQPLADSGFLDVRVPESSDQPRFDTAVKNFRGWGDLHFNDRGIKTAFSRSAGEPIPFFNESAASQIIADVKDGLNSNQSPGRSEALFNARIFLEFAQEFDRRSYDIYRNLGVHDQKVKHLFADLQGADDHPAADNLSTANISRNTPDEYMIIKRLEAWLHLFQKDAPAAAILLTASRPLLDHLLDKIPTAENIHSCRSTAGDPKADPESLRVQRNNLMATLALLVKAEQPASADLPLNGYLAQSGPAGASLNLYLIPDLMPLDVLAACLSKPPPRTESQPSTSDIRNTLIGLVEVP